MLVCHNRIPSDKTQLWKNLLTLMTFGPQDDEGTYFPDRVRMDLAFNYIQLVFGKVPQSQLLILAEEASSLFFETRLSDTKTVISTPYWQQCLERVSKPWYMAAGDETRTNRCALERIEQSIHAKTHGVDIFASLLEVAAKPCLDQRDGRSTFTIVKSQPLLRDMLSHHNGARGAKGAFEMALNALLSQWIMLGHFAQDLARDEEHLAAAEHARLEKGEEKTGEGSLCILDRLASLQLQSVRLLDALGKVCSYAAWLYSLETGEGPRAVARFVRNAFYRHVEEHQFDPPEEFMGKDDDATNREYWVSTKLSIVLGFDSVLCPGLRRHLANGLGVAKTYNACFGKD